MLAIVVAGVALGGPPWMPNDTLTAADMNALNGRIVALETANPASKTNIEATLGTSLSAASMQFVRVPYGTASTDALGEWDASTGTFKAKFDGTYEICASLYTPDLTFTFELDTFIDGNRKRAFALSQSQVNNGNFIAGCSIESLTAGQTLDVRVFQGVKSSAQFNTAVDWNTIQIVRL